MVGGDYVNRNYEAAAEEARIVQIAIQKGARAEVDIRRLMVKRLWHTGSTLRPRSVEFKARIAETLHEKVWPLFEARTISPVIGSTYPLDQRRRRPCAHGCRRPYRAHRPDGSLGLSIASSHAS